MKKFPGFATLFAAIVILIGCNRNDNPGPEPLRDYQTQYTADIAEIEEFLKTHSFTVVDAPGMPEDQNVTFTKIPPGDTTTPSIWDSPLLMSRNVDRHDITYKLYYLKLREGGGAAGDKPFPCNVDGVVAAYNGRYLFRFPVQVEVDGQTTTVMEQRTFEFESSPFPQSTLSLENVIRGWSEVFPQFRSGDRQVIEGEPIQYSDFGAGVVFIPSGLGYYGQTQSVIPKYSPLIFSFKLMDVVRLDQDNDGIPSYLEDLDGDRYIRITGEGEPNPDNSDYPADLVPDYLDLDDDADQVLTENEILNPETGEPYDYSQIPTCPGGNGLPKHRDPSCQ